MSLSTSGSCMPELPDVLDDGLLVNEVPLKFSRILIINGYQGCRLSTRQVVGSEEVL